MYILPYVKGEVKECRGNPRAILKIIFVPDPSENEIGEQPGGSMILK
jgi:hypothetical protein